MPEPSKAFGRTAKPSVERQLPLAVDRLGRAVAGLVDPRKRMTEGAVQHGPSLYEALVGEVAPDTRGLEYQTRISRSTPPVWVDALDQKRTIDDRARRWSPSEGSTPARLREVAARRWRPQDTRLVTAMTEEIRSWSIAVRTLLDPPRVMTVAAPCPACGTHKVYRSIAGESVRVPALQLVAEKGCSCLACGTSWAPDRYLFLCRLLGFALPAGVLE